MTKSTNHTTIQLVSVDAVSAVSAVVAVAVCRAEGRGKRLW